MMRKALYGGVMILGLVIGVGCALLVLRGS